MVITVWREMIGIERKAQAAALGIRSSLLGRQKTGTENSEDDTKEYEIPTPVGRIRLPRWCPTWLFGANMMTLMISLAVFAVLLFTPTFTSIEQSSCLAMLVFVSLLWATEVSSLAVLIPGHPIIRYITPRTNVMRPPPRPFAALLLSGHRKVSHPASPRPG